MDGERVRDFLSQEAKSLIATYRQFETLVASASSQGSKNPAEDGRYVESLLRDCLRKFLPKDLHVGSGFILRPAVKTGDKGTERRGEKDQTSKQLDVMVVDCASYPTFQRFEDAVIVPPEGVVGIISVKENLRNRDIKKECQSLSQAVQLCRTLDASGQPLRGPFLALIGMDYKGVDVQKLPNKVFDRIRSSYELHDSSRLVFFDEAVGYVGAIRAGSAFKERPRRSGNKATYIWQSHDQCNEEHLALQFLITGILSVYYDSSRSAIRRPGFTGFEPARADVSKLGEVKVRGLRWSPKI